MRWGQQFRFFHDEVIATMIPVDLQEESTVDDEEQPDETREDEA